MFFLFLLGEVVLTNTSNLCFEQKYEKYQTFLSKNFQFLVVKVSVYLNRLVFVIMSYLSCVFNVNTTDLEL